MKAINNMRKDSMNPADVDLSPLSPFFDYISSDVAVKPVEYIHIYECDKFSVVLKILIVIQRIFKEGCPTLTFMEDLLNISQRGQIPQLSNFNILVQLLS